MSYDQFKDDFIAVTLKGEGERAIKVLLLMKEKKKKKVAIEKRFKLQSNSTYIGRIR